MFLVRALFVFPVALAFAAPACGSDAATNFDGGTLLEASTYTPGPPVSCGSQPRMCSQEFIFPYGGESYVEIVGSWGSDTWQNGIYMNHTSNLWQAFVPVAYGHPVSYAFLLNGSTQVTDPGNSHRDANGNSVTFGIDCASFTCAEPPDAGGD